MKNFHALAVAVLLAPVWVWAQDESPSDTYTYATYFYCDVAGEDQADALVAKDAPVADQAVADGVVGAWGYLAHHTGGKWRRVRYHQADSLTGALEGLAALNKRLDEAGNDPDNTFGKICSAHDDYIWKAEAGTGGDARGSAGLSVYLVCNFNGEERADEIVKNVFAPIYDKAIEDGKITSWGWQSHVIGGKYRRLSTLTAADFGSLLEAREEILDVMYGEGENAEASEFSDICGSHTDYLWEIRHEKSGS